MASTSEKAVLHTVQCLCSVGLTVRHASPSGSYYLSFSDYLGVIRVSDHGGMGRGDLPIWGRITVPDGLSNDFESEKMERLIATGLGYYLLRAAREGASSRAGCG